MTTKNKVSLIRWTLTVIGPDRKPVGQTEEEDEMGDHMELHAWVRQMADMCQPDRIYWCDGSDSEKERLRAQAISTGELILHAVLMR